MVEAGAPAPFSDTHAHLADPALADDAAAALDRARARGVQLIIAVGYDLPTSEASLALADREGIWATVGIHPNSALGLGSGDWRRLAELAREQRVVAIGETGLDYYRDRVPREGQRAAFEAHLALADEVDKPVVVHNREAHADVLRLLAAWASGRKARGRRSAPGVLHCFSGDIAMAEAAVAAGLMVSFAGNLTYPAARDLAEVAKRVELDSVLIETDSPYLSPAPLRGRRNEPGNVTLVANRLAALRGLPVAEVASRTTANAARLFGVDARLFANLAEMAS